MVRCWLLVWLTVSDCTSLLAGPCRGIRPDGPSEARIRACWCLARAGISSTVQRTSLTGALAEDGRRSPSATRSAGDPACTVEAGKIAATITSPRQLAAALYAGSEASECPPPRTA